jgi:hypothetical protein
MSRPLDKEKDKDQSWPDGLTPYEGLIREVEDDNTFHIGQFFDGHAAHTVECKRCSGRVFNVGVGGFFTAIRCVKCEWEYCIHNG